MTTPADAPDPKRQKFPLREQAEEAHRILGQRYKTCLARVKSGEMSQAEADRQIALVRAIRDTLHAFATYEDETRTLLESLIRIARSKAEVEELRKHPAVGAVLAAFPDAEVQPPDRGDEAAQNPARGDTADPPPFGHDYEDEAAA